MLIACVGTGTGVGKTWVGVEVLGRARRAGWSAAARKPIQSFDPEDPTPTDAALLGAATGEATEVVCPPRWSYRLAMAPPMAAAALGLPLPTIDELVAQIVWPDPGPRLRWLEGLGGVRSPLASDGDNVELCRRLHPDLVVVVSPAGLGTINAVRLSMDALDRPSIALLNRFDPDDPVHAANRRWLTETDGYRVVTSIAAVVACIDATPGG